MKNSFSQVLKMLLTTINCIAPSPPPPISPRPCCANSACSKTYCSQWHYNVSRLWQRTKERLELICLRRQMASLFTDTLEVAFREKTPSLGFDYCENRKVHLNLKGKLPVLGDAVELTITQNTYLVKRLTSLYLPWSIVSLRLLHVGG